MEVSLATEAGQASVKVRDTGRGISPAFLPHVFERLRQEDASKTRKAGGLGIGLAIAKAVVELHHGTIRAESPGEARGTTFTVMLPLTASTRPWRGSTGLELAVPAGEVLRDLAVLVVDDDADAREAVSVSLARLGAHVSTAASVAEAMGEAARRWPAVLVSDIGMPGEDGISLIEQMRRLESTRGGRIRAVALTAYASEDDRRRILDAGYDLHVPKPVNTATLIALLVQLLAGSAPAAGRPV